MLIVGAGGLAAQMFDDLQRTGRKDITFWSEQETKYNCLKENYTILVTNEEVINYFTFHSREYVIAIWDIEQRKRLTRKFNELGGLLISFISPFTTLSTYSTVGTGSIVLFETGAEPGLILGKSCIVNKRISFGHGCSVSSFCSIGPCSIIASDVELGENCYVGMGAIIQPKTKVGKNVIIAAGSVVTRHIPDNAVVSGSPARIRFYKKNSISDF